LLAADSLHNRLLDIRHDIDSVQRSVSLSDRTVRTDGDTDTWLFIGDLELGELLNVSLQFCATASRNCYHIFVVRYPEAGCPRMSGVAWVAGRESCFHLCCCEIRVCQWHCHNQFLMFSQTTDRANHAA
jgi:hypothetical protein